MTEQNIPSITLKKPISQMKMDPNVRYIKLHGLQRSGTNFINFLIANNFKNVRCLVNVAGWKHGHWCAPMMTGEDMDLVVTVKNPYSWLVSVYKYWGPERNLNIGPDLRGVPFEDFLKNKLVSEKQKGIPYLLRAANPIQHWNNMYYHWSSVKMAKKQTVIVTYESLLQHLDSTMKQIQKLFTLERVDPNKWFTSENCFEPSGEQPNLSEKTFDSNFYTNNEWLSYYTPELIEYVNDQLDLELMIHFGYELLEVK